jgi:hypothetical protein
MVLERGRPNRVVAMGVAAATLAGWAALPTGHVRAADTVSTACATVGGCWSGMASPATVGLYGTSCVSSDFCMAVGHTTQVAAAEWNGSAWSVTPAPDPEPPSAGVSSILTRVSCTSPTFCVAVGSSTDPTNYEKVDVIEHWNGSQWSLMSPAQSGAQLIGVSCTSASFCVAVGGLSNVGALIERWDGATWTRMIPAVPSDDRVPDDDVLNGVSCTAVDSCMAVSDYYATAGVQPLAERWDGSTWTVTPTTNPGVGGSGNTLFDVSCSMATMCVAVGQYYDTAALQYDPLIEQWDGSSWSTATLIEDHTTEFSRLQGVSCSTTTFCVAVGFDPEFLAGTPGQPIVTTWNGVAWTPMLAEATLDPWGVSCPSAAFGVAVGGNAETYRGPLR